MEDLPSLIGPELASAIAKKGYTALTPVQEAVLDPALAGRDLRISSQTGSGKTVAIGFVVREVIRATAARRRRARRGRARWSSRRRASSPSRSRTSSSWLFAPLRVASRRSRAARATATSVARSPPVPRSSSARPAACSIISRAAPSTAAQLGAVVLDEADRMLDLGFRDDLEASSRFAPEEHRTHLVSATFPREVHALADRVQNDPAHVEGTPLGAANTDIEHVVHLVDPRERLDAIVNLLLSEPEAQTLVFARTRADVAELTALLERGLHRALALRRDGAARAQPRARGVQARRAPRARRDRRGRARHRRPGHRARDPRRAAAATPTRTRIAAAAPVARGARARARARDAGRARTHARRSSARAFDSAWNRSRRPRPFERRPTNALEADRRARTRGARRRPNAVGARQTDQQDRQTDAGPRASARAHALVRGRPSRATCACSRRPNATAVAMSGRASAAGDEHELGSISRVVGTRARRRSAPSARDGLPSRQRRGSDVGAIRVARRTRSSTSPPRSRMASASSRRGPIRATRACRSRRADALGAPEPARPSRPRRAPAEPSDPEPARPSRPRRAAAEPAAPERARPSRPRATPVAPGSHRSHGRTGRARARPTEPTPTDPRRPRAAVREPPRQATTEPERARPSRPRPAPVGPARPYVSRPRQAATEPADAPTRPRVPARRTEHAPARGGGWSPRRRPR